MFEFFEFFYTPTFYGISGDNPNKDVCTDLGKNFDRLSISSSVPPVFFPLRLLPINTPPAFIVNSLPLYPHYPRECVLAPLQAPSTCAPPLSTLLSSLGRTRCQDVDLSLRERRVLARAPSNDPPTMSLVEEWWKSVPPVTRTYICLSVVTAGAIALEVITPLKLYLDWSLVLRKGHVWRIFTNFLYFGDLSLDFLFHMFFLYRYCKMLETNSFRGRTADFLYMLIFGALMLTLVSPLTKIDMLGPSLTFMMVYVWGRRNSRQAVNFLGVLSFRAPYLPWVLLLFSFVLGSSPATDLMGILVGHVYYYMADVYPAMAGVSLLKTPRLLQMLVGNNDDFDGGPFDDHVQEAQGGGGDGRQQAGWGQGRMLDGAARQ